MSDRVDHPSLVTTQSSPFAVGVLLCGALLVHLVLMPAQGWERDQYWFATWMRTAIERGVAHVSEAVWCDYPPGYLYVLKAVGVLWTALVGAPIPADGTVALRFLVKLVPTMADLATAWVLYRLAVTQMGVSRAAHRIPTSLLVLAGYAYNPAIVFTSAVWGQVDSLTCLLLLLAVWAIGERRCAAGGGLAAAAVLVKLQAVVVVPALLLATAHLDGWKGLFAAARGAAVVVVVLLLPFFVAQRTDSVIATMFGASGRYPFISMNAHNLWWFIGGARSINISDAMRVGNDLFTYQALGFVMFASATLLLLWRLWRDLYVSGRQPLPSLIEAALLQLLAFYLFPTEMHERYIVPALVFLAALCIWKPRAWWLYVVCSLAVLVSLASTLSTTFPQPLGPVGWLLRADRAETFVLSTIFVAVFVALLFWTSDRRFQLLAPAAIVAVVVATAGAATLPLRSAQLLSEWEPTEQSQEWATMRRNRSVDDHRLSAFGFMFRHGIGTHAASRLTYHLNGAFRVFDTALALDDEANRGQMIRFRILTDGSTRFDSGNISGGGFPRHVRVPIDGAQFLTLEVLDGGDGINSDHADWLEPTLLR